MSGAHRRVAAVIGVAGDMDQDNAAIRLAVWEAQPLGVEIHVCTTPAEAAGCINRLDG